MRKDPPALGTGVGGIGNCDLTAQFVADLLNGERRFLVVFEVRREFRIKANEP